MLSTKTVITTTNMETNINLQIQRDVYSAHDVLLEEAKRSIENAVEYDQEEYERLMQLQNIGFRQAQQVKAFAEAEEKKESAERLKERIAYYEMEYPLNRFINEDSVKTICEKYGLVLTTVYSYIADIPEKNQKEIVNFRVKNRDVRYPSEVLGWMGGLMFQNIFVPRYNHWDEAEIAQKLQQEMLDSKVPLENGLIIAPKDKLDLRGKTQDGHIMKIDDPIVLQPVKEGYLIVSSWGFEASDELVVNKINN